VTGPAGPRQVDHAVRPPPDPAHQCADRRSSRDLDIDGDLLIADGVVRDARRGIGTAGVPEGTEIIDCRGKVMAPGLIDIRAFVGEPGAEYRETFASVEQAAAAGGVTTLVSQPDTSPASTGRHGRLRAAPRPRPPSSTSIRWPP
jgi:dihydroorotase-like cyclic amidohydrolase